jgi:hypothetical protein
MQNIPWKDLVEPIIALAAILKAMHSGSQAAKAKESVESVKLARKVSTKERDTQIEVMEEKIKNIEVSYKKDIDILKNELLAHSSELKGQRELLTDVRLDIREVKTLLLERVPKV